MKKVSLLLIMCILIALSLFAGCNKKDDAQPAEVTAEPAEPEIDLSTIPLRELADNHNLLIGGACEPSHLEEENFKKTFAENFNQLTPENCMKMESIQPIQGTFAFEKGDALVAFAKENDIVVKGHNLVWHLQTFPWLKDEEDYTRDELMEILETHITTVVTHYKGDVAMWDVVNEPLEITDFRETIWYNVIGPEYVELSLQWAHAADPDAKLYLNDYFVEENNAKSTAFYNLVVDLLERDIPLDGVGLQFHVNVDDPLDLVSVYTNVKRFTELGIDIDFTEIDVRIPGSVTDEMLAMQAQIYADLVAMAAAMDGVSTFTTWGMTDKYTWVPDQFDGYSSPLLFDENYQTKPALTQVKEVLAQESITLDYENQLTSLAKNRVILYPLHANKITTPPILDGVLSAGEWDETVNYSFVFNQLETMDQTYKISDIYGEWRVGYNDGYFYGCATRIDDILGINDAQAHENDCIEVFLDYGTFFIQLRSVVGESFAPDGKCEDELAVWSEDGSVVEFMVKLPIEDVTGMVFGFNIALSDNDGSGREVQLYPITGVNESYLGKDLVSLKFEGDTPRPSDELRICPPFTVNPKIAHPVIDGPAGDSEWAGGTAFYFGYNQLSELDQSMPDLDDCFGNFRFLYDEQYLFGRVNIIDDVIYTNTNINESDHITLSIKLDGQFYSISCPVGGEFEKDSFPYEIISAWNADNTCLEYRITFDAILIEEQIIPYNISYTDNDGEGIKYVLYPITGQNKSIEQGNVAELIIN